MRAAAAVAWPVNIGEAARLSGVSAKMVRHYESLGLLPRVARTDSGYRQYSEPEVHTLRFIKRARDLGFSMDEIGGLVGLWQNRRRTSAGVRKIAQKHAEDLGQRIVAMQEMQRKSRTESNQQDAQRRRMMRSHASEMRRHSLQRGMFATAMSNHTGSPLLH